MILDDETLVERVAKAMENAGDKYIEDQEASVHGLWLGWADIPLSVFATAAIEAVRVHMWDDGK